MTVVRAKGKPHLFITVTCSTEWREIARELGTYQKPQDRPDIVSRVFNAKLTALLAEIKGTRTKPGIFGTCIECLHVVEMQQRGYPHAHLAVILKDDGDLPCHASNFEKYTTAEIPDEEKNPRLFELVKK